MAKQETEEELVEACMVDLTEEYGIPMDKAYQVIDQYGPENTWMAHDMVCGRLDAGKAEHDRAFGLLVHLLRSGEPQTLVVRERAARKNANVLANYLRERYERAQENSGMDSAAKRLEAKPIRDPENLRILGGKK